MTRDGRLVLVTVIVGGKAVEVECTVVADVWGEGWSIDPEVLRGALEDAASEQLAREAVEHAAE